MKTQEEKERYRKIVSDELSDFQKEVIIERLGIGVDSNKELRKTREEVAKRRKVNEDTIREIEEKAVNLLIPMKTKNPKHVFDELSDFQKEVIIERLGIGVDRRNAFHKSREEVAKKWKITEENIRRVEEKAINILSEENTP